MLRWTSAHTAHVAHGRVGEEHTRRNEVNGNFIRRPVGIVLTRDLRTEDPQVLDVAATGPGTTGQQPLGVKMLRRLCPRLPSAQRLPAPPPPFAPDLSRAGRPKHARSRTATSTRSWTSARVPHPAQPTNVALVSRHRLPSSATTSRWRTHGRIARDLIGVITRPVEPPDLCTLAVAEMPVTTGCLLYRAQPAHHEPALYARIPETA
jgi:hypothetical protein